MADRTTRTRAADRRATGAGPAPVHALSRGLFILSQFTAQDSGLSLSDLSRKTGLHRATVYRFVKTLQAEGFLMQDSDEGVYRIGLAWAAALYSLGGDSILFDILRHDLKTLAESTGEGATLSLRRGDRVQLMHVVPDSTTYAPTVPRNSFAPLSEHAVAQVRIHLAYADRETQRRMTALRAVQHTEKTVTDPARVRARLAETARDGIAICHEEYKKGLCAIAVPIFFKGDMAAGLGLLIPTERFDDDRIERYAVELRAAAATIGQRLEESLRRLPRGE